MVLPLTCNPDNTSEAILEASPVRRVLDLLSENLPNLSRLHLGLKTTGHEYRHVDAGAFFVPLDAFARSLGPCLTFFAVSASMSVFNKLMGIARAQIRDQQGIQTNLPFCMPDQFWRNIDGTYVQVSVRPGDEDVFRRMYSPYPNPPSEPTVPGAAAAAVGYWILYGDEDLDMRTVTCS